MTGDCSLNRVRLGIRAGRCIAAFSDRNQATQGPTDYNIIGQSRSSVLLVNENGVTPLWYSSTMTDMTDMTDP